MYCEYYIILLIQYFSDIIMNMCEYKQIKEYETIPYSLCEEKGKLVLPYIIKENEHITFNVTIKEYSELEVDGCGFIIFPKDKKYKASMLVHINGNVEIMEPNYEYKWFRRTREKLYIRKEYRDRITGMIMCEDIYESYVASRTYISKELYKSLKDICDSNELDTEIVYNEVVVDNNDDDDPDVTYKRVHCGYKIKESHELVNELVFYERKQKIYEICNFMRDCSFVKSILIRTNVEGKCSLTFNQCFSVDVEFNKVFDLTLIGNDTSYTINKIVNQDDVDGLHVSRFQDIRLCFRKLIDDFNVVIEKANIITKYGKRYSS
jgi:hypothetical protein